MKPLLFAFLLMALPAVINSQTISVGYHQTLTIPAPGAVAAFSLDDYYADAKVQDETLTIFGKNAGIAHVVEVKHDGTQTLEVQIVPAPLSYPPGFIPSLSAAAANENGSYESRYSSNPAQSQNTVDFLRREGDRAVQFHLSAATFFTPEEGSSRFALTSVFYQVMTRNRDIVVLDQLMSNSPLTVDGSIVRGFHFRQGGFLFHIGYASFSSFENFFLPSQKEGVIGAGYRFSLGEHAALTPNLYYFPTRPGPENPGQPGTIASLVYTYERNNTLGLLAETGYSHGMGGAARFFYSGPRDHWSANFRYEPVRFASLSLNSLHGLYSNLDWTRYVNSRLTSTVSFTGDHYTLPTLDLTNVVANLNLQYQISSNWFLISGANYGATSSRIPVGPRISTFGLPAGLSFYSTHFQGSFLYQYAKNSGALLRSDEYRGSLGTHWNAFRWSGFVDRQTQAPTISFILAAIPGLQDALDTLAISATTPEQIALALRETAALANQGFIEGVNINLSPVRLRAGSDLTWSNHAATRQQLRFSFVYNRDNLVYGDTRAQILTAGYSLKFRNSTEISAALSLFRSTTGVSQNWRTSPLLEISVRRRFGSTPNFVIPRRRGIISGVIFSDDGASGTYRRGAPTLAGVEVVLDDTRKTRTDARGRYTFTGVSYSPHVVEAIYRSSTPFFFTTASRVQSEANSEVNFGVGLSTARISGFVRDEAGHGLPGLQIEVASGAQHFRAPTDDNGKFRVEGLAEKAYEVRVDVDSVPTGYSLATLKTLHLTAQASAPAEALFTLRAIRSISGHVTVYDLASQKNVPVASVSVVIVGRPGESATDVRGLYLFRNLPSGAYTVLVNYRGRQIRKEVVFPDAPALENMDIQLGTR